MGSAEPRQRGDVSGLRAHSRPLHLLPTPLTHNPSPAADELRKLGREIVRLNPRSVERMSLKPELLDVAQEWSRVGGKRGSGAAKKGKARLEALFAQCVPRRPGSKVTRGKTPRPAS